MSKHCTRRRFLAEAGRLAGSTLLGAGSVSLVAGAPPPGALPRRRLGRTGVEVSVLGVGLAPMGMADYSPQEFRTVVGAALDEGVSYFDVQPNYGEAEKCRRIAGDRTAMRTARRPAGRSADQRAFPDAAQQLFEPGEVPGAKLGAPFVLDVAEDVVDFRVRGAPAPGEADHPRATPAGRVGPDDVAEPLQTPEQLVHGLLAHAGALSESAGANSIRTRKLQHRHVRHAQLLETGRIELLDDAVLDRLGRDPQQRADEHVPGPNGRACRRRGPGRFGC